MRQADDRVQAGAQRQGGGQTRSSGLIRRKESRERGAGEGAPGVSRTGAFRTMRDRPPETAIRNRSEKWESVLTRKRRRAWRRAQYDRCLPAPKNIPRPEWFR